DQLQADVGREGERLADADAALARLAEERQALERSITAAEAARGKAQAQLDAAATALAAAETGLQQMTEACATGDARRAALARLNAEAEALARKLPAPAAGEQDRPPVLSLLQVPEGFEAATAALFDGELAAPLLSDNRDAPAESVSGWVELPPFAGPAALPEGVHPLAGKIGAPAALGRRLGQAGWVDSEDAGWPLQPRLPA